MSNMWGTPGGYGQGGGYGPPGYPPPAQYSAPLNRPGVVTWFIVYCVFMALLYAIVAAASAWILASPEVFEDELRDPAEVRIQGIVMLVVGLPLMALFAIAPMLPRRPWVWIYDIVLICLGLTSCCLLPATISLLVFWLKPEAKMWFGRTP